MGSRVEVERRWRGGRGAMEREKEEDNENEMKREGEKGGENEGGGE